MSVMPTYGIGWHEGGGCRHTESYSPRSCVTRPVDLPLLDIGLGGTAGKSPSGCIGCGCFGNGRHHIRSDVDVWCSFSQEGGRAPCHCDRRIPFLEFPVTPDWLLR